MIDQVHLGIRRLWITAPAFILGLQLYLGLCFIKTFNVSITVFSLILSLLLVNKSSIKKSRVMILSLFMFIFGSLWASVFIQDKTCSPLPISGYAIFKPSSISLKKTMFRSSYLYSGTLSCFSADTEEKLFNLPCHIFVPNGQERPKANSSYLLRGTLKRLSTQNAEFSAEDVWLKIPGTHSLAELRFTIKMKFKKFLKKHIRHRRASDFFFSICTGEIENKMLSKDFGALGLQHILAISGFHFGLIALFTGLILRKILPSKMFLLSLFILLTSYFLFLGCSPSVFRAWLAMVIWITGQWLYKRTNGLNTLGVCLILEVLILPRNIFHLGFQLSFLCTAALLLITPITERWIAYLLPIRSKQEILSLVFLDKIGYRIACFLRKSLSVTLAVHIVSIPVCLYVFKTFPLLSLLYNLFIPLLVTICLAGFIAVSLVSLLCPWGSEYIFYPITSLTSYLLQVISFPPPLWHFSVHISSISLHCIILYLLAILLYFQRENITKKNIHTEQIQLLHS